MPTRTSARINICIEHNIPNQHTINKHTCTHNSSVYTTNTDRIRAINLHQTTRRTGENSRVRKRE